MTFIQNLLFSLVAFLFTVIGKLLDAITLGVTALVASCFWTAFCLGVVYPALCHAVTLPRCAAPPPAPPTVVSSPSRYYDPRFPGAMTLKRPDNH